MKKKIFRHMMLVAFVGSLMVTGCKKDDPVAPAGTTGQKLHITAEMPTSQGKTYVDSLNVKWVSGDKVRVNGGNYNITENGDVDVEVASDKQIFASFPASIISTNPGTITAGTTVSCNLPDRYVYATTPDGKVKVDLPMVGVGEAGSGQVTLKQICSVVKLNINNFANTPLYVSSVSLTNETDPLCGTVTIGSLTSNPEKTGGTGSYTVSIAVVGGKIPANGSMTVMLPVLPTTGNSATTIKVVGDYLDLATPKRASFSRTTSLAFVRATVHDANISMNTGGTYLTVNNLVNTATFTVGKNGTGDSWTNRTVKFSPGNLIASTNDMGANWTWSFASEQYFYVGNNTANTAIDGNGTVNMNGSVDLFGWSTPSTFFGINYRDNNSYYSGDFKDWGECVYGNWRTLESAEWDTLLTYRMGGSEKNVNMLRYAKVKVHNVNGMIVFPDNEVSAVDDASIFDVTINKPNTANNAYTQTINDEDWTKLESNGCVFLPAAGYRNGTGVNIVGADGDYWSSTALGTEQARNMFFSAGSVDPRGNNYRYFGFSVRLVQD